MKSKPRTGLSVPAESSLEDLRKKQYPAADQECVGRPAPSSRRQVKPTSLWFCANESCSFHDHLTPLAAKDARRPQPGALLCPQCNADTLVPANKLNMPPWYDHETFRKNLGHPVEPTFPDVPSRATREGEKA